MGIPITCLIRCEYQGPQGFQFEDLYYDAQGNQIDRGGTTPNSGNLNYPVSPDLNGDGKVDDADTFVVNVFHGSNADKDLDGNGTNDLRDAVVQVENARVIAKQEQRNPTNRLEGWQYHPLGMAIATPDGLTYQYNLRNRMVAYGPDQHIAYDCEEKRMATWSDGQADKNYVLFSASGKPLEEYRWDGIGLTLEKTHYYLGENLIASDVLEANKTCPTRIYAHSDHLGSPRQYSDTSGQWIGYKDYYAFGNNWAEDTACLPITADYTGHQTMKNDQNPDHALIWMQARTYHPIYGRFLSRTQLGLMQIG